MSACGLSGLVKKMAIFADVQYQGRKWLSKSGGASSNMAAMAAAGGAFYSAKRWVPPPPVTPLSTILMLTYISGWGPWGVQKSEDVISGFSKWDQNLDQLKSM